ncbi:MAG: hypothetical protein R3B96_11360 [Pirellulaceae bacterium]
MLGRSDPTVAIAIHSIKIRAKRRRQLLEREHAIAIAIPTLESGRGCSLRAARAMLNGIPEQATSAMESQPKRPQAKTTSDIVMAPIPPMPKF